MKLEKSQIGIQIKITLWLWESLTELLLNYSYNLLGIIVFVKRKSKVEIYACKHCMKLLWARKFCYFLVGIFSSENASPSLKKKLNERFNILKQTSNLVIGCSIGFSVGIQWIIYIFKKKTKQFSCMAKFR